MNDSSIHAGCVVVGEAGVLVRGPSGSGKSTLARAVAALALHQGRFARLVADDRVVLNVCGGRLIARPHPLIAGSIEVRGLGIVAMDSEPSAIVRLVVDCESSLPDRIPLESSRQTLLLGLALPRMTLVPGPDSATLVLLNLDTVMTI